MGGHRTMSIGGATYDLFVRVPHDVLHTEDEKKAFALPLGEKIRVHDITEACGGGAGNTSVGLARLGCQAHFEGVVGDDQWGEKLTANFTNEGVNIDCMTTVEDEVSSFSIILSTEEGQRVILYEPGTNEHLHDATFDRAHAASMDWVYLNHIQAQSCDIENDLVEVFLGENSPKLTWNPGGCQIEAGMTQANNALLLRNTDLLLLNTEEALQFADAQTAEEALQKLADGGAAHVCITDGSNGTLASDGKKIYHCPILEGKTVSDTTGAGDAFGTGATWALLEGFSLPEALRVGSINAASVVGSIGAQAGLLTNTDMKQRLTSESLHVDEV